MQIKELTRAKKDVQRNSFMAIVRYIMHLSRILYYERSAWLPPKPLVPESNSLEPSQSICQELHQSLLRECETHEQSISVARRQNTGRHKYKFSNCLKGNILYVSLTAAEEKCKGELYCFFIVVVSGNLAGRRDTVQTNQKKNQTSRSMMNAKKVNDNIASSNKPDSCDVWVH